MSKNADKEIIPHIHRSQERALQNTLPVEVPNSPKNPGAVSFKITHVELVGIEQDRSNRELDCPKWFRNCSDHKWIKKA